MELLKAIQQSETKSDDWRDALYWLLCTVAGNLPIWFFLIPLLSLSQPITINFFENGEFALYSVSLLFGAFYMVSRETIPFRGKHRGRLLGQFRISFPSSRPLSYIILFLILISITVLVTAWLQDLTKSFQILDELLVSRVTLIIFSISLILGFVVTGVENGRMKHKDEPIDVEVVQRELEAYRRQEVESLEEDFDEVGEAG